MFMLTFLVKLDLSEPPPPPTTDPIAILTHKHPPQKNTHPHQGNNPNESSMRSKQPETGARDDSDPTNIPSGSPHQ